MVAGLVWVMGFGGCAVVGLVFSVVLWKRERYGVLGFEKYKDIIVR